jgi:hypothetical protein
MFLRVQPQITLLKETINPFNFNFTSPWGHVNGEKHVFYSSLLKYLDREIVWSLLIGKHNFNFVKLALWLGYNKKSENLVIDMTQ